MEFLNILQSLSLFLFDLLIFSSQQYFKFSPFIIKHFIWLPYFLKFWSLFWKLLLGSFKLLTNKNLSLRLYDNCVLNFVKLFQFWSFLFLRLLKMYPFRAKFKNIKKSHFLNKFCCVIRIMYDIFSQSTSLKIACCIRWGIC